jgi:hypothetical protein
MEQLVEVKLEVLLAQSLHGIRQKELEYEKLLEERWSGEHELSWEESDYGTFLEGIIEGFWTVVLGIGGVDLMRKVTEQYDLLYPDEQVQEQEEGKV